jgi:long-chain acyl-CoA synthetase
MKPISFQDLPLGETIHETILASCERNRDNTAHIRNDGSGGTITFGELARSIKSIAGGLKKLGLQRGDRVGIISPNCPEWETAYLAILAAGGTVVPLDTAWKESELSQAVKNAEVKIIFVAEKLKGIVGKLSLPSNVAPQIISFDSSPLSDFGRLSQSAPFISGDIKGSDPAAIIYTSGTSGDPKGVVLTHHNILSNIDGIVRALEFYPNETFLSLLPLHHTLETTCGFLTPLCLGLKIVFGRSYKSRDIIQDIVDHRVNIIVGVPLLFEKFYGAMAKRLDELAAIKRILFKALLLSSRACQAVGINAGKPLFSSFRKKAGLSSIRIMVSGGAPLPPNIARWFTLLGFSFMEGYGLSECSPVVAVNRKGRVKIGSVGFPLPNLDVAIDEPTPDGIGEIIVRGPNCSPGYLNNPEATASLINNGWLHTGDLGKLEKGWLYITGRKKNLIISGAGKNIYPEEIEAALHISPFILESVVFGKKKESRPGEEVHAIIVPNIDRIRETLGEFSVDPADERLRGLIESEVEAANDSISDYKRIVRFEIRFEELEKTSSKKVKRALYR